MMMVVLKILAGWTVVSLIASPILLPMLARRFRRHDEWITAPARPRRDRSVTPQGSTVRLRATGDSRK